ncbi:nucleoside-diphosphate kinase [Candidatus Parcubacteria bacterium]|nr:nucleoside-diphosphate kinase [Candidatus Parcubacteria bacterium]
MTDHPKKERTFVAVKPDGVQRSLIGEIIKRFERVGLKLVALKLTVVDEAHIRAHYAQLEKRIQDILVNYMTSGPVVAMVWEGAHAVKLVRKLVGKTEPHSSDVGTIRGDFTLDSYEMSDAESRAVRNLIHASGNVEEATFEIAHWFKPDEITNYKLVQESILYDVNLDGILE